MLVWLFLCSLCVRDHPKQQSIEKFPCAFAFSGGAVPEPTEPTSPRNPTNNNANNYNGTVDGTVNLITNKREPTRPARPTMNPTEYEARKPR